MKSTILVIEDDEDIRYNIAEILTYEGMECLVAQNGRTGMQLALDGLPDLIICDIMMPGMNGYEVLLALQNDPLTATIPFIFLTAKADQVSLRAGMELGADDYLTKPFTSKEIMAAITTRLQKKDNLVQEYTKRTNELRHAIIYSLPHELRTPLMGILLGAELWIKDATRLQHQESIHLARTILESSKRLQRLIENYLCYAQLQMLRSDQERQRALLQDQYDTSGALVQSVAEGMAAKAQRLDDLVVNAQAGKVRISSANLQKIIEELLDNAFKFSVPGTQVVISTEVQDTAYVLTVRDQGRGMSREQIKTIGVLQQFGRDMYEQQGAGMGLAIVHQLAELHQGTLVIHSDPERGTSVLVRLLALA